MLGCVFVVDGIPLAAPSDAEPPQVPRAGFSSSSSSCHPSPVSEGETELVHFSEPVEALEPTFPLSKSKCAQQQPRALWGKQ